MSNPGIESFSKNFSTYFQEEETGVFEVDTSIDERIVINVGGIKHETYKSTLHSIPDTRLYWLCENPCNNSVEYSSREQFFFFDRHPAAFEHILNFYRTG